MIYKAAVLALTLFAGVFAQSNPPAIPNTPDTFIADVTISIESGFFPQKESGVYYCDYPNQRDRIDVTQFGMTMTQLDLYEQMVSYEYGGGRCKCTPLNNTMNPVGIPFGSTYEGTGTINGVSAQHWHWDSPFMPGLITGDYWVNVATDPAEIVRTNWTTTGGMTTSIVMDVTQYTEVGPITNPAIFAVPKYCPPCPGPAPPPFQPDGSSCPNNPDRACQCAQSSELKFCTLLDYPVSNVLDIATLDAFVEQAYNLMVEVWENPSQNCLANYKAFLCSFYFPQCIGTENPQVFLPCADLCPLCACTGFNLGNCTSSPSTTACTKYGTTTYC